VESQGAGLIREAYEAINQGRLRGGPSTPDFELIPPPQSGLPRNIPPGYIRTEDGTLEPDPGTAPVVAEASKIRADGTATVRNW
jgi:hypothetical protein